MRPRTRSSSGNFYTSEIGHGMFFFGGGGGGGLSFGQGIFLGFDFCPHSIIPVTGNPEYPAEFEPRSDGSPTRVKF